MKITVCDICRAEDVKTINCLVGRSSDGHRTDDDILCLDPCEDCRVWLSNTAKSVSSGEGRFACEKTARAVLAEAIHMGLITKREQETEQGATK